MKVNSEKHHENELEVIDIIPSSFLLDSDKSLILNISCKSKHHGYVVLPKLNFLEDYSKSNITYEKILRFNSINKVNLLDL